MSSDTPVDTSEKAVASRTVRSAVSNGSRVTLFGDGRSAGARRFRDLVAEFAAEAGGMASLPASAQQLIRRLAQVSVELELLEAQRASGAAIDPVAFATIANLQRRLLGDLRALAKANAPKAPTLAEHLERMAAQRAAREASTGEAA